MAYGNITVIFMVIAVVTFVLALVFAGTYCLNRAVDQNSK